MNPIQLRDMLTEVIEAELVDCDSDVQIHVFAGEPDREAILTAHRFQIEMLPDELRTLVIGTD